jgi:hypothetical protein
MNEHEEARPRVSVSFKRSSTKDAGEGFDIDVYEGCPEGEADRVMALAKKLREEAIEALKPKPLLEQLEESLSR